MIRPLKCQLLCFYSVRSFFKICTGSERSFSPHVHIYNTCNTTLTTLTVSSDAVPPHRVHARRYAAIAFYLQNLFIFPDWSFMSIALSLPTLPLQTPVATVLLSGLFTNLTRLFM